MASDIGRIIRNLIEFYDFTGKSVIHVGAGGGQIILYARSPRSILAVDNDPEAVARLRQALASSEHAGKFQVVEADFLTISDEADVVFFEFCLHEMADPDAALAHARTLAPEILVIDHLPESRWTWYCAETEKARRSWAAVEKYPIARRGSYETAQVFDDFGGLLAKAGVLGEPTLTRIREFETARDIRIEMPYGVALIRRSIA